jgi:hypothetical protein
MRISSVLLAVLATVPALAPLQKPAPKSTTPEVTGPVALQVLAPLESIAHQLAKGGRERETKDLLAALEKLGYPKANHEKLAKACHDELGKAKDVIDSLPQGAKQLRITTKQIVLVMQKLEGDAKLELARHVLLLDGECEEAHAVLGHVKVGKTWVPESQTALREQRGVIFSQVQAAKKLDVEMETGEIDDEIIQKACGVKATFARRGIIELHSNFSVEKTTRLLRETLRAVALSSYIVRGDLKLIPNPAGPVPRHVWVLIDSREQYMKLATDMAAAGEMNDDDVKMLGRPGTELSAFTTKHGAHVHLAQWETSVQAALLVFLSGMQEGLPTPLTTGHLNWIALSCFGCTLPNFYFKEEKGAGFGDTHVETEEQKREREELLRLAKAGIAGSRAWMAFLAERGEDPAFARSFVDAIGAIQGNDLHKCTSIVEFLQEAQLLKPAYKQLVKNPKGRPGELYAAALGMSIGDLEAQWREWILGSRPGVAERIDKANDKAWPPDALKVLAYMNEVREHTFKGRVEGLWKLKFDADLSEPCGMHAHYLTLHPEQQKWPDAHEEYADKEAYTTEGAWAGTHSDIVWKEGGLDSWQEAVDVWLASFYHRLPLVDPGVLRLGWGSEGIYAVLDMGSLAAPYEKPFEVVYPYDGQTGVPTSFLGNEYPDPVPDGKGDTVNEVGKFGYPVTLQTRPVDAAGALVDIVLELFEGKDGKIPVECHFSSPQKPTNPENAPAGAWCLIPKAPLKVKTEYKAVADWKVGKRPGGETTAGQHMEWTFKTN